MPAREAGSTTEAAAAPDSLGNPILNSPYEPPEHHFEIGLHGPTGQIKPGRRPSESFVPIATARKGMAYASGAVQAEIDFDVTGERRERNTLINDLRREVERWRHRDYEWVTPTTRKLLQHWSDPGRDDERVFFCQREAAETAIFLAEVAGRHGYADWRARLIDANQTHNAGLPRVALKMATGSGKTVVMAMLIAWQTLNKVQSPRDSRFTSRFLVVTPGITIRDRLRVLQPGDPGNYYDERSLLPPDLSGQLAQAQVVITNYHTFLLRDAKEIRGVSATTRKILLAGRADDPFQETPAAMVTRLLRDLGVGTGTGTGKASGSVMVFNDEAHHCYVDKTLPAVPDGADVEKLDKEQKEANEEARVWFRGVQAVARHAGVKTIYDLSATPYYLKGSGYAEGHLFPWTVSDFSLMDAIESGIVKIPRTPVDDDATGDLVTYLRLWDYIGDALPKRRLPPSATAWIPPPELEGAVKSLYRSYERSFQHWEDDLRQYGEPPPVFIVVCPSTVVSKLVYDWIAGTDETADDGTAVRRTGNLTLFSNLEDGRLLARPRSILVDSVALERGEKLSPEFKRAAETEIAAFQADYRTRNPGADTAAITDEELLREVMNTVGKRGRLGEHVRCVVSVAMLTEGWDANTVTHILGIRRFGSQLLCEQVVGRGLRRRSYAVNEHGRFEPEYAGVYGIPFAFIPSDRQVPPGTPPPPAVEVHSVAEREPLRITFPRLDGYRVEVPDEELLFTPDADDAFEIGPSTVPTWTESAGIVGSAEQVRVDAASYRNQQVAFGLARRLLDSHFSNDGDDWRPWLFPRLLTICRAWLESCVRVADGYSAGYLAVYAEWQAEAVEAIHRAITVQAGNRRERLRPILRRVDPVGSTGDVQFMTRKGTIETVKSEVSHVTFDGKDRYNSWEHILALECELHDDVAAYVKNDHLGFTIPYVHLGRSHQYVPDFLLRLRRTEDENFDRTLIVEVSGSRKSPGPTKVKALTARDSWCAAVNNAGSFGRWGYVETTDPGTTRQALSAAIASLYADEPIIGDPDLLDFDEVARGA